MTETLSHQQPESPEQDSNTPEAVEARFNEAVAVVEDIIEANKDTIEGRSSFSDITGNLRSTIGPDLRYYKEDGNPEDFEEAQKGLHALEAYIGALRHTEILDGELKEGGADPELRQRADELAAERKQSAVQIYAHQLAAKANAMDEENAQQG